MGPAFSQVRLHRCLFTLLLAEVLCFCLCSCFFCIFINNCALVLIKYKVRVLKPDYRKPRKVDIRVVSATNADLRQMVQEHTFREDLFYRINLITVHLPALRERREDIPLLVRHFADKQCESNGLPKVEFTSEAMDYLSRLPYPGNIRELKNLVERTLLVSGKEILTADDFKSQYQHPIEQKMTTNLQGMTLEEIEKQTILQTLEKYNNNMSQVAIALGISRAALYRRLEKYNIQVND